MGELGLVWSLVVGLVAFFMGWLKGCEDEKSRIREAFRSEDYTYSGFLDVLEKYENQREAAKYWAKHEKRKRKIKK